LRKRGRGKQRERGTERKRGREGNINYMRERQNEIRE
jgi:hypothetical protein